LGHQWRRRVYREGTKFFKLRPTHSSREGQKIFSGETKPSAPLLGTGLITGNDFFVFHKFPCPQLFFCPPALPTFWPPCSFTYVQNIVNKVTFVGFKGEIASNAPAGSAPERTRQQKGHGTPLLKKILLVPPNTAFIWEFFSNRPYHVFKQRRFSPLYIIFRCYLGAELTITCCSQTEL